MISTIKKMVLAVFITALSVVAVNAQDAPKWEVDKMHTSVDFSINHFFSSVTGNFKEFDGAIYFDPNNLEGSKAEFSIAVNSVDTDNEKRDNHLASADFFNAEKYPKMTFVSTKFEKKGTNDYLVHGKLTIKDVTKNIALPMKVLGTMTNPMMEGHTLMGLSFDTTLDRTDYGVGTGSWAATAVVGDEVKVHIPMEVNRKK
ncbi:polyisoprenoid-binding protein YceI [Balneicella halophila]|uniref:Polyisoprenoid-binding protein YceI n=1 Tax=Balneicella halophila TaxID=1537566 RepID=A0A7L4USM1_BALHA|nr:YceI family protein [Balneicella halophila]PVX52441.1 polyisoprenoid-binding protein YceI [Balneicella halophila]